MYFFFFKVISFISSSLFSKGTYGLCHNSFSFSIFTSFHSMVWKSCGFLICFSLAWAFVSFVSLVLHSAHAPRCKISSVSLLICWVKVSVSSKDYHSLVEINILLFNDSVHGEHCFFLRNQTLCSPMKSYPSHIPQPPSNFLVLGCMKAVEGGYLSFSFHSPPAAHLFLSSHGLPVGSSKRRVFFLLLNRLEEKPIVQKKPKTGLSWRSSAQRNLIFLWNLSPAWENNNSLRDWCYMPEEIEIPWKIIIKR